MRRILVLGGTRYFGKRLVENLLNAGDQVTIATRGLTPDSFGERIERIKLERTDASSMQAGLGDRSWDLVYDQMCYSPNEAKFAVEALKGRAKRYILTSSQSVYLDDGEAKETDFNPFREEYALGSAIDFPYGTRKRYAESLVFQSAHFPVSAVRFPIVLGEDDYSGRLEFHVRKGLKGAPHVVSNLNAAAGFIHASDAAKFLFWLGNQSVDGPINAASPETISIGALLKQIGQAVGRASLIYPTGDPEHESPLVNKESRYLNVSKAQLLGFEFQPLDHWLPQLIQHAVHNETRL